MVYVIPEKTFLFKSNRKLKTKDFLSNPNLYVVFNSQCCHGTYDDINWNLCCIMGR